ncbi:hypothetical protein ACG7TL_002738 [Trametes sanguinea]
MSICAHYWQTTEADELLLCFKLILPFDIAPPLCTTSTGSYSTGASAADARLLDQNVHVACADAVLRTNPGRAGSTKSSSLTGESSANRRGRLPGTLTHAVLRCRPEESRRPSAAAGYAILVCSVLVLLVGSYAVFFSAFLPKTGIWVRQLRPAVSLESGAEVLTRRRRMRCSQVLDVLAEDRHYKYLVIMLIPAGTGFVIANWVGWQYYMNS